MIELGNINDIMQKEVSRKEFLYYIGVALLSVIGVTAMLQNLSKLHGGTNQKESLGYGASPYGH